MRDRWRIRTRFGTLELELDPAQSDPGSRDESGRHVRQLASDFTYGDREARRVLREVHLRLQGGASTSVIHAEDLGIGSPRCAAITEDMLWATRTGRLVVRRLPMRAVVVPIAMEREDVLGPEPEPTEWLEIELVDEEGSPVPGMAYRVECADGWVRTGWTNAHGKAREEGLRQTSCKVSFPELHARDWKAA